MTQDIKPIKFTSLSASEKKLWQQPKSFAFASHISQIPLSESELLLTSHHLPVAIDYVDDRLQVVAITTSQFQRAPVVGPGGQWQKGYVPIALRCLPFRLVAGSSDVEKLEIAVNLDEADGTALSVFATDGLLSPEVKQIQKMLDRLEQGKRQLQEAAEKLFIAGVLSPFQLARLPGTTALRSRALTVDRNKLGALSKSRAAHLVKDSFLPIDVASACIFSQRLMPSLISVATEPARAAGNAFAENGEDVLVALQSNVKLDGSQLFSFELFDEMSRRDEG